MCLLDLRVATPSYWPTRFVLKLSKNTFRGAGRCVKQAGVGKSLRSGAIHWGYMEINQYLCTSPRALQHGTEMEFTAMACGMGRACLSQSLQAATAGAEGVLYLPVPPNVLQHNVGIALYSSINC